MADKKNKMDPNDIDTAREEANQAQEQAVQQQAEDSEDKTDKKAEKKEKLKFKKDSKETAELEKVKAEKEELQNKVLRQMAEFDNFKKRTAKEKDELFNFAKASCMESVLGVIDNFERALDTACSDAEFKKGVEMIFAQFSEVLTKLGVEEISAHNQPFDPEYHNAVNQIEDENFGENTVCQVLQKGYKLGDRVIRHAMVIVANP